MIQLPCPRCGQYLDVMESQLGKLAECPHCATRFQIPLTPTPPPATPRRASGIRPSGAGIAKRKPATPHVDDDLEDFDEESESRPKRGKSRNRPRPASTSPGGIDGFTAMLIALACIMVIFSVVGSYIPMALIVPGAIGLVITIGAGFWLLIFPFNESAVQGFLCLIVPFYALFYLAAHFDEMWRPFVLQVVASLMVAGSAGLYYYLSRIPVAG